MSLVTRVLYCVCIVLVKFSILDRYLQVFVPSRRGNELMFYANWAFIIVNVLVYLIEIFLTMLGCSPPARAWNPWIIGTCIGQEHFAVSAGVNILMDTAILILPLYKIWHLQMSTRIRIKRLLSYSAGILSDSSPMHDRRRG